MSWMCLESCCEYSRCSVRLQLALGSGMQRCSAGIWNDAGRHTCSFHKDIDTIKMLRFCGTSASDLGGQENLVSKVTKLSIVGRGSAACEHANWSLGTPLPPWCPRSSIWTIEQKTQGVEAAEWLAHFLGRGLLAELKQYSRGRFHIRRVYTACTRIQINTRGARKMEGPRPVWRVRKYN